MSQNRNKLIVVMACLMLFSLACQLTGSAVTPTNTAFVPTKAPTEAASPTETPVESIYPVTDVYAAAFAEYPSVPVQIPSAAFQGYSLPFDLSTLPGLDGFNLSELQKAGLTANGFVVRPPETGKYQEFYQVYETYRYSDTPVFITTDAVFHIYHLIFDKMLRDLERDYFISTLQTLSQGMYQASLEQYQQLMGTNLEDPARRNTAFFAVALRLLEMPVDPPAAVKELVDSEVALIEAHSGATISPLWDRPDLDGDKKLIEDYSQYIPRGHYTRSEELKRYFKAMMWYGRLTYRLRDIPETQRALLVTKAMRSSQAADGTPMLTFWQQIYEPTVFIVGKADDLGIFEYGTLSDKVFGSNADLQSFGDDSLMAQFMEAAKTLPPPQVNSMWVWIWEDQTEATKGFRFMGQRFTLDQYVFGQLIWRKVGNAENPRWFPKALDFFAAAGSQEAEQILMDLGENQYDNYESQMVKVKNDVATLELDSWTQNLYWSWLYAFQPVIEPKDERYPAFMRTQAWIRKSLNTVLGSFTELKHDTILYAKQVMAEMGGGPEENPPHGYVEPDPEAYARLISLAQMTYDGLAARNLLSDTTNGNLTNLLDMLTFLKNASEQELAGQELTTDDYFRIKYFGGELEALTLAAADTTDPMDRDLNDQKAALVADIATGALPDGSLGALTEAIGEPTEIYVILPGQPVRLGVGAVFTYYEFIVPAAERMTDEAWQAQVAAGSAPALPSWTDIFIIP